MAVDWSNENVSEDSSVTVFTDSQSLCIALKGTSPAVDGLRRAISTAKPHITIQWVPGHCGVPGNELANAAAKAAASKPGPSGHISYKALCAAIKRDCADPPSTHLRTKSVYASVSHQRDAGVKTRNDQSLLAKLRSGHYTGLRAYRSRTFGTPQNPNCDLWTRKCRRPLSTGFNAQHSLPPDETSSAKTTLPWTSSRDIRWKR